jgi:hypothetical protein
MGYGFDIEWRPEGSNRAKNTWMTLSPNEIINSRFNLSSVRCFAA